MAMIGDRICNLLHDATTTARDAALRAESLADKRRFRALEREMKALQSRFRLQHFELEDAEKLCRSATWGEVGLG